MIITICASSKFFDRLISIEKELESLGHKVILPSMDEYPSLEEDAFAKIQHDLIREHFNKIDQSDAILVVNFEKNGIKNYVGGSGLMEMGKAFDRKIPIFMLNGIPEISYKEEIKAMKPVILHGELSKIN
ncbi:hypothetical protein HOC80_03285 [archaeon]|jgi:hypothetical protein|nr:hypothetical protein [archaeon]MBT4417100.1 hypothetical protein [archaeon]